MNVFSEGHRDVKRGPGYLHPEWQSTLYEPALSVMSSAPGAAPTPLSDRPGIARLPDQMVLIPDGGTLKAAPGSMVSLLNSDNRVLAQVDGASLGCGVRANPLRRRGARRRRRSGAVAALLWRDRGADFADFPA